jgi:hypothetical protein
LREPTALAGLAPAGRETVTIKVMVIVMVMRRCLLHHRQEAAQTP